MQSNLPFEGRIALVTGASRGIGKEISRVLIQKGAFVYVNSRDMGRAEAACEDLSETEDTTHCKPVAADVSRRDHVDAMISRIIHESKQIDFLVNNAGVTSRLGLLEITDPHWDEVMDINLRGVFLCTQAVVPHMMKKKFGRIVSASSYAAWHAGLNRGVYAAAKAGIAALTKVWAGELAPHGINMNAYAPGDIITEMTKDIIGADEKILLDRIALHRFGTVQEVAELVSFLLSPSSGYLTGVVIEISGGKFVVQNPSDAWGDS
jgi:3-oxoacyl-[acyl-carrier protein] reductase